MTTDKADGLIWMKMYFYAMEKELGHDELELISDKSFFITKAIVTEKLSLLMADAQAAIREKLWELELELPDVIDTQQGKLSKGENYRHFPWIILDFPKYFSKEDVFALRTLFLWGDSFSCTFHLQGEMLEHYREKIEGNIQSLNKHDDIYICVNEDQWEHHFGDDNYRLISEMDEHQLNTLVNGEFIKLSRRLDLRDWSLLPQFSSDTADIFLRLLR